ncbi:MAG: Fic family protein [Bacteroidetes bacterium]|nr:Fic family protein [Bacteroidota bacterium]
MPLAEILHKLDQLKDETPRLTPGQLVKLHHKLRLEMNYNSNRMEGNTLTREETLSVMRQNLEIYHKPLKDVLEMNGHDKVMQRILDATEGQLRITEKFIKELHTGIMSEPDDPEKAAQIGKWKTRENYLLNYKGERVDFTAPKDTPQAVNELINWLDSQLYQPMAKGKTFGQHPVQTAAEFHLRFVNIHPFYDGNGRVARLLTGVLLMAAGYPLPLIALDHRDAYLRLLAHAQAYEQDPIPFYAFIAERVLYTQQLIARAARNESLEEPDDLDKEIAMLDRQLEAKEGLKTTREAADYNGIVLPGIRTLAKECLKVAQKFERFFMKTDYQFLISDKHKEYPLNDFISNIDTAGFNHLNWPNAHNIYIQIRLEGFAKNKEKPHSIWQVLEISLNQFNYAVRYELNSPEPPFTRRQQEITLAYHETITDIQAQEIARQLGKHLLQEVKALAALDTPPAQ